MELPQERSRYRPSGRIEVGPFFIAAVIAVGVAVLAAYILFSASDLTFPGIIVGPMFTALPVAGTLAIAIHVGKCRNPWVGVTLGLLVGLIADLGAFQFQLAAARGNDHLLRLDLLPEALYEHVHNDDLWQEIRRGNPNRPPARPEERIFRWVVLSLGWLISASISAGVGWFMSARPFSESHGRWLKAWVIRTTREEGQAVADAVYWSRSEELGRRVSWLPMVTKLDPSVGFAIITLEYIPGEHDSPVYFSATVVTGNAKSQTPWPKKLASRVELTPTEAAAIADNLPTPIPGATFGTRGGKREGEAVSTAIAAKVLPLPDQDVGCILTPGTRLISTLIGFSPLILGLTCGTAAGLCAWAYHDDLSQAEFVGVIVIGSVALLGSFVWLGIYADYLPALYFHAVAKRIIGERPDGVVDPNSLDAFFVQMIPRANWGRVMLENADDFGFMILDSIRGVILFEGDRERWVIPRESVLSCELESFDVGPSDPNIGPAFWLVVLKANVGGRVWEAPITLRPVTLVKHTPSGRRQRAEELQRRIRELIDKE